MRRLLVLAAVIVIGLVALFILTRGDGDDAEPVVAPAPSAKPGAARATTPPRSAPGELPSGAGSARSQEPATSAEEPGAVTWRDADLSKRIPVQRDDDSVAWPKDAPPPPFSKATVQAIRAAVTPAVNRCMEETRARYPDAFASPDLHAEITIRYTARASGGTVSIPQADVSVQGFPDDELAACVKRTYATTQVAVAGQSDATGSVFAAFTVKK